MNCCMTCSPHQQLAPVSKLNVMQRVKNGFHIGHVPRDARDVASKCAPTSARCPECGENCDCWLDIVPLLVGLTPQRRPTNNNLHLY